MLSLQVMGEAADSSLTHKLGQQLDLSKRLHLQRKQQSHYLEHCLWQ